MRSCRNRDEVPRVPSEARVTISHIAPRLAFRGRHSGASLAALEGTNVPKNNSRYVVVRDNRAGVYAGVKLKTKDGKTALRNARHIWSWQGRLSTADIAARGLGDGSKVAAAVKRIELCDVVQINDCNAGVRANIEGFAPWQR